MFTFKVKAVNTHVVHFKNNSIFEHYKSGGLLNVTWTSWIGDYIVYTLKSWDVASTASDLA